MYNSWHSIQSPSGTADGGSLALHLGEADQDELAHAGRVCGLHQVSYVANVSFRQKSSRQRCKQNSSKVDNAVNSRASFGETRRVSQVRPVHRDIETVGDIKWQFGFVKQKSQLVRTE